jgi:hypothetical protein
MSENKTNSYHSSKIYKIFSPTIDKVYYGATLEKTLRRILSATKSKYNKYSENNNSVDYNPAFEIFKNDDAEIVLVEKFKCEDVDEFKKKLYDYINDPKNPNINNYRPEGYKKPVKKVIKKTLKGGKIPETTETETMTDLKPILKNVKTDETKNIINNYVATEPETQKFSLNLVDFGNQKEPDYMINGVKYPVKDGYILNGNLELNKLKSYPLEKQIRILKHFEK